MKICNTIDEMRAARASRRDHIARFSRTAMFSAWCRLWAHCTRGISRWCGQPGKSAIRWPSHSSSTLFSSVLTKIWPNIRAILIGIARSWNRKAWKFCLRPAWKRCIPAGAVTYVTVEGLSDRLCGRSRPGHFRGVTTVVAKLFNIVQPDLAFFGQKDAAQVAIIRRMVRDLNIPVQIVSCPIVREPDGLAMSSRNAYLDSSQRKSALVLYRSLMRVQEQFDQGERKAVEADRGGAAGFRGRTVSAIGLPGNCGSRHARPG